MNITTEEIQNLRQDYKSAMLTDKDANLDPIIQFNKWFEEALTANIYEPNVMTLATADKNGKPSARVVLLKGMDAAGFTFYSNYLSRKGKEMKRNPQACLVFFWPELERQVRIEGRIEKLDKETSEAYFHSRPKASQIGAVVSPQSQPIPNRVELEQKAAAYAIEYAEKEIPKPAHWGGYILKPTMIEFWQGRESRLHDRLAYQLIEKKWRRERLAP